MVDGIQFNASSMIIFGSICSLLLSIIALFLRRLLQQFDLLTETVRNLNDTMVRIDKDLSGEVGVLQAHTEVLQQEVRALGPLWERVRVVEQDVIALRKGGCDVRCMNPGHTQ